MTAARAAVLLGRDLIGTEHLHGGDLSPVMRLSFADGGTAVLKSGPTASAEADMLRAIAASGARAPKVLAVEADLLLIEDLGRDTGPGGAWQDLAVQLGLLHGATGPRYGWHRDHAFGPVPILNRMIDDWPEFWAENRLHPFLSQLPADLASKVEALTARLPDLLPARPAPALLHGDLWTGNIMARGSRITGLIDPACYCGHAEVDLAMLCLFGQPGAAFWQVYPTDPGFRARLPIYQLFPALVHLRLFGQGYRGLVESCLAAAG